MTKRGWTLFLAMSAIWGVPYLMIKVAVRDLDPLVVAFGRTLIGGLLLLPIAFRHRALRPVLRRWKWLLGYTLVEITFPWFFLGHAETKLDSSTAGLLLAVVPLFAAIMLTASGQDRLDLRRIAGLIVGLGGVGALVGLDVHLDDLVSVGAVMLTAIGYALGPIIINRKLSDLPPIGVVTGSLVVATVVYAPFVPFLWPSGAGHTVHADTLWSVAGLAVVCTATAFVCFFALIAEAGPARATVITYVNPAVAIALGVLLLHERFTVGTAVGFVLVIAGSVLATAKSRSRTRPAARRDDPDRPAVDPECVATPSP